MLAGMLLVSPQTVALKLVKLGTTSPQRSRLPDRGAVGIGRMNPGLHLVPGSREPVVGGLLGRRRPAVTP
jgi:hypothetical protein